MKIAGTRAAIVGVGGSAIEKKSDRSLLSFALDAAIAAIEDAGLTRDQIDGYVGAPSATNPGAIHADGADELSLRLLARGLGLTHLRWSADLFWDFSTGMIVNAAHALAAGSCDYVLAVRAIYHFADRNYGSSARTEAHGEEQFEIPFGYRTAGARFAMRARAYLEAAGASRRDLFPIVALARANAARNPLAVWRDRPITLDEYLAAPMIAAPLCRLDCDMPVCGAVAFVVTRAELAASAPHQPAYLAGWAGWQRPESIFEVSRRPREEVHLCQLYDGFSAMIPEWLERLGWCEPYTALKFIGDGQSAIDGKLPVNTFGGSIGEGRLHGAGHVREAVLQISGRAGARQVSNAENCLVQVGPQDFSSVLMLSSRLD